MEAFLISSKNVLNCVWNINLFILFFVVLCCTTDSVELTNNFDGTFPISNLKNRVLKSGVGALINSTEVFCLYFQSVNYKSRFNSVAVVIKL